MQNSVKFDHEYRKSDEYLSFCQCLKSHGVDEMMWDYCIMLHKSNPSLYKTEKRKNTDEKTTTRELQKAFDTVEILPPTEDIVVS
jgi:hypothetical protein